MTKIVPRIEQEKNVVGRAVGRVGDTMISTYQYRPIRIVASTFEAGSDSRFTRSTRVSRVRHLNSRSDWDVDVSAESHLLI